MDISNSSIYISNILTAWYKNNKRELPWRDINDPYLIWISEIILQQTRVAQGISYYIRFIERFPTVKKLAETEEGEVLKYWQGLGYYTRARNLHKAAIQIMTDFNGIFPTEHKDVLKLAGVGEYTAAAICSFAYNKPYAVVDGNVYRVLSRLFGIEKPIDNGAGKKEFASLAHNLLSKSDPALHNQSIMEFGALCCIPVSPGCEICPLKLNCQAYELNLVAQLPLKSLKTKVIQRFFNYLFIEYKQQTFLQKRVAKDIWQNLFEFPLIESDRLLSSSEILDEDLFKNLFKGIREIEIKKISIPMRHVLSHRIINTQFFTIQISDENDSLNKLIKLPLEQIDSYAVSRLMELFFESIEDN